MSRGLRQRRVRHLLSWMDFVVARTVPVLGPKRTDVNQCQQAAIQWSVLERHSALRCPLRVAPLSPCSWRAGRAPVVGP
jgi:hypothetical protein